MKERDLQDSVLSRLRLLGGWWVKTQATVRGGRGTPDILGCWHGRFVAIEMKAPGKKARPLQRYVLEWIRDSGGLAFVVDGQEKERDLYEYLQRLDPRVRGAGRLG
ncbi:MAG: VRR-NUC domain-containing protein [Acidobacteria bacterium]|nr:VRR-NUC domain-containing protein [Acidobacteriota bacterium]